MVKKRMNEIFHDYIFDFYNRMRINQINLIYEGEITHEITKAFTALTEENMNKDAEPNSVQMKVFHIIVESLQNISKHAESLNESSADDLRGVGTFLIAKSDKDYFIIAGNIIDNDKKAVIKDLLDKINSLDKDGLKLLHKEQMKKGRMSEKGGAGLGFIDIARKSGNKLDYEFKDINGKSTFFIINTKVSRNIA
jgi:hypothetical protein